MTKLQRFSARHQKAFDAAPRAGLLFNAATADSPAEILIYDQIGADWFGEGVLARDVAGALAKAGGKDVVVRINSPGGNVFEGYAIYNALKDYEGAVNVVVDGLAASAASYIALAGDTVAMHETSMMMIHNASTMAWGNKADLEQTTALLGKIDNQLVDIYVAKTGAPRDTVTAAMDAETWMTGAEAVAAKYADSVIPAKQAPADKTTENGSARRIMAMRLKLLGG